MHFAMLRSVILLNRYRHMFCWSILFLLSAPYFSLSQTLSLENVIGEEAKNECILREVENIKILGNNLCIVENDRVVIVDTSGNMITKFGGFSSTNDNTIALTDVAMDERGNYLVATQLGLKMFSSAGHFIKEIAFKKLPSTGYVINVSKLHFRNGKWYILDGANHNIKVFDRNFNMLRIIGKVTRDASETDMRYNMNKYKKDVLIDPKSFYFDKIGNICIVDFKGNLKRYDKYGKFIDYLKVDDVQYWVRSAYDTDNGVLIGHPNKGEIYSYINNELVPHWKLNAEISNNPELKLSKISSFCVDKYNYYVTISPILASIAVISRKDFKLRKIISFKIKETLRIDKPTRISVKDNFIYVQEYYSAVKKIDYSVKPFVAAHVGIEGPSFDFLNDSTILNGFFHDDKIFICDTTGRRLSEWANDLQFHHPSFIKRTGSHILVIDEFSKASRISQLSKDGRLVKQYVKNGSNANIHSYSATMDDNGNLYFSQDGSIYVYDSLGNYNRKLGGYGSPIRPDLNLGLGVTKSGEQVKLHLGDYDTQSLHFRTILKMEIYKNILFVADDQKIILLDFQGNIKGYIGGKRGSKIGEFQDISDFCISNNRIFIADTYNRRIFVYRISM